MKRTLSTGLAALVAIAGVVLGSALPAAAQTVLNERFPISTTITDCAGETIFLSGTQHELVTRTIDARDGDHFVAVITLAGAQGTSSSGVKYVLNNGSSFNQMFNIPKGAAFATTVVFHLTLVRQGSTTGGDNLKILLASHLTLDANGNITSATNKFSSECVG